MTTDRRHLVIGLAGAGKSTFIAALRQITEAGDVEGALRLVALGEDDTHVNALHGRWIRCEQLERTRPEQERVLRFRLTASGSTNGADLEIPDLSGELIEQQWSLRLCAPDYLEAARSCSGVLLFVHPRTIVSATRIADANVAMSGLGVTDDESPSLAREYDPRAAQTQVKLVELLQFLREFRGEDVRTPVAIAVSAWDLAEGSSDGGTPSTPLTWLSRNMPLFFQFLSMNADRMPWQAFGVSAQGGDLGTDHETLLKMQPSKRVRVVNGQGETCSITAPIVWLDTASGVSGQ